jgi:hypothetical protein
MSDRLTKEQAREFMERRAQERRPQVSEAQRRWELGRDLIDQERAEQERRARYG